MDGVMQRPNAALSANSTTADSSSKPFHADSKPFHPPQPDQTWRINQGIHLQRQLVQLCEQNNIDFSRSAMLHSFEPQVETVYQLWCTQTRIKGLCFLGICALGQSVVRWVETYNPTTPYILPGDVQFFLDAVISCFSLCSLLFSGWWLIVTPERQATCRQMVHAMLIIIPMLFFGMVSFLILSTLYDDQNNTPASGTSASSISVEEIFILQSIIMLCPIGLKILIDPPISLLMLGTASNFAVLIRSPHIGQSLVPFSVVMTLCITMAVWFLDWRNRVKFIDLVKIVSLESIWFRHFGGFK